MSKHLIEFEGTFVFTLSAHHIVSIEPYLHLSTWSSICTVDGSVWLNREEYKSAVARWAAAL